MHGSDHRTGRWLALGSLTLALFLTACNQGSAPPAAPAQPQAGAAISPDSPARAEMAQAQLVLDLALGDGPDQPGRFPDRVGGISPKGPRSFAVDPSGEILLLDNAHLRLLRYRDGQLIGTLPLPWLDEGTAGLYVDGYLRYLRDEGGAAYGIDHEGRMVMPPGAVANPYPGLALWRQEQPESGKQPVALGRDAEHRRYEVFAGARGPEVRRLSATGQELVRAAAHQAEGYQVVDWYLTAEGGVYTLGWTWDSEGVVGAQVHRLIPPDLPPVPLGDYVPPVPRAFDLLPPASVRIAVPDWLPVEVTDPVAIDNLWSLLSVLTPADGPPDAQRMEGSTVLLARWADGRTRMIHLYPEGAALGERAYRGPALTGLAGRFIANLTHQPDLAAQAVEAATVQVAYLDLPGAARPLQADEKQALAAALRTTAPAHFFSTPQPLADPYPNPAFLIEGEGWRAVAQLRGEHHLAFGSQAALVHDGQVAELVRGWLRLPEVSPGDVADLYRADRLEIKSGGQTADLSRWRDTVVRYLLGVKQPPAGEDESGLAPFTLIFHVRDQARAVEVDAQGFTYAGRRYERPGLLSLQRLQGVP